MPKGLGQHTLKSTGLGGGNEVGVDPKGDRGNTIKIHYMKFFKN